MGYQDLFAQDLVADNKSVSPADPEHLRKDMLQRSPAEREHYTLKVAVNIESFHVAQQYIDMLLDSANAGAAPGGLWLIGEGGTGKTFILSAVHQRYRPVETALRRRCPVLSIPLRAMPTLSSLYSMILLQLGQDPRAVRTSDLARLREMTVGAFKACETRGILFDEAEHLWSTSLSRGRPGGVAADMLKELYDETGIAYVFSGGLTLEKVLHINKQALTRWSGVHRLEPFSFDARFVGLLRALDAALPMEKQVGLGYEELAPRLFQLCQGNFRLLKRFLAKAVRYAATAERPCLDSADFARAYFAVTCETRTPFGDIT